MLMKKPRHVGLIVGLLFTLATGLAFAKLQPKVIYGDDDRLDYYQVSDPLDRRLAEATVALMEADKVNVFADFVGIEESSYGAGENMCADEPFFEQKTAAFCSGFLVAPDLIMTAGHCVRSQTSCNNTRFVFNYRKESANHDLSRLPAGVSYSCKQLVARKEVSTGEDYALIQLDRVVLGVEPVRLARRDVAVGDGLVVMGYPWGLPLKIAAGANVRSVFGQYFVANLDTYGGNSGSAVFNRTTGEVEGILVRGERDYVWDSARQCRRSNVCANSGCRGEDVTLISRAIPDFENHLREREN